MVSTVKNINTFTDYGAEAQDIERRRKMAELLQQQSAAPIEERPGVPISWTQGLAKMLQAYYGKQGIDEATQKERDLAGRAKMEATDYFGNLPQAKTTDLNPVAMDDEGNTMPPALQTTQPTRQEMMSYALKGSMSGNPLVQPVAGSMLAQYMKQDDPYTLAPGAVRMGPNNQPIASAPFKPEATPKPKLAQPGDMRQRIMGHQLVEEEYKADGTWQEVGRGPRFARQVGGVVNNIQPAPVTPVTIQDPNDPNGTIIIDGRTKAVLGKGAKFSEAGKLEKNRQFSMSGIGATIQEAEDILKGTGGGELPTNSTVGNVLDVAGGVFGISPSGAKEADQLKVLAGALISKVPRMQGPQSDKDVVLYKQMAGQVGDATLPRARRLAALEKVKELYAQYEGQQGKSGGASASFAAPSNLRSQADAILNGNR